MAKTLYEKDNTELDGSTESVDKNTKGFSAKHLFHIVHDLDVSVTATFYGTHEDDDTFDDGVQIGQTDLVSGGDKGFETLTDPWEKTRVELVYGANPSSGSITVKMNSEG